MKRTTRILALAGLASSSLACGAAREPLIPAAQYLAANPAQASASWAKLAVGTRVAVTPSDGCVEEVVSSPASTSGAPLTKASWPRQDALYTIVEAMLAGGEQGHLALTLLGDGGSLDVLRIPQGKVPTCIAPASDTSGAVASWLGKPLVFRPERSRCHTLEAAGSNLRTELGTARPVVFRDLVTAPSHATGKGAPAVWLRASESLRVRADVVASCFEASADAPSETEDAAEAKEAQPRSRFSLARPAQASARRDVLRLLRLNGHSCRKEPTNAGEHLECSTPAGVWHGTYTDDQISLRLTRRTLGTMHLIDGALVDPQGFATNIVAVRVAAAEDASVEQLQTRIRQEAARVLAGDESARMAVSDDERANLELTIDVGDIQISQVATRTERIPHEYQDGTRRETNPKKQQAKDAATRAKEGIKEAQEDCKTRREDARDKYASCMQLAKSASNLANGKTERTIQAGGEAACAVWRATMNTSCSDEISEARQKYEQAVEEEQSTPDMIDVPNMKRTTYDKRILSRTVRGRVTVTGSLDGAPLAPTAHPFEATVEDFEVDADAPKKIEGHRASAPWLTDEKTAVPAIAPFMAGWVVKQVRSVLGRAAIARAKATLHRAGEEVAAGTEAIHGLALQVGGDRIRSVVDAGTFTPRGGNATPVPAPARTGSDCLLVVAMLPEGSAGKVSLSAGDDVADVRGKPFAHIELCPGTEAAKVELVSNVEEPVQWAAYRTTSFEAAPPPADPKAPAQAAEQPATGVRPAPIEAMSVFARGGAATWLAGSIGDDGMGDVFTPGPSLGVGGGLRVGSGWLAYGEWERSFVGVGTKSPIFGFREVSSHGDAFLIGARKTFTGWAVRAAGTTSQIAPLVDLALGYAVLRQDGTDVAGDSRTLRLPSATARLLLGVSVRPFRWLALEPVVGSSGAWVNQIEAEQTVAGTTRAGAGQLESGSIRASLFGGLGVSLDFPLGEPSPPPPAPARTTAVLR